MKAERRHELQENSLAHILSNLPLYLSVYGGRILLILTLIVLAIVLVRYRSHSKAHRAELTRVSLASAREAINQLSQLGGGLGAASEIANRRALLFSQANEQLDQSLSNAENATLRAEAMVARGDLYWTLANLPDLPGAATQPALALPRSRPDLLESARLEYEAVLSQYPKEQSARATALLGLAAVAENRGEFDTAAQRYEQVVNSDLPRIYKSMAQQRLSILPMIRTPRRLVLATMPAQEERPSGAPIPFLGLPETPLETPPGARANPAAAGAATPLPTTQPATQPIGL
ncbi:MAG: hypothetical protein NZ561_05000 [Phycisphaerae bacterium]|nr:hypothetical protein [Phycisphaerae bacterium]MDW8261076.1 hypothetical protein [Phycisphaerales bacterium]